MTYALGNWEPFKELILQLAQERSVDKLLRRVVDGIIANRMAVPLCGVWLCDPTGNGECSSREENHRLRLAVMASRGLNGYEDPSASVRRHYAKVGYDDPFIGRAAQLRETVQYPSPEDWSHRPHWARRAGIVGGGAHPLLFKGDLFGVLAVCVAESYVGKQQESRFWLRMLADHIAAAIANAKAFDEIENLRRRLDSDNDYFREELRTAHQTQIVGSSPAIRRTLEQIELVAPIDTSVLILGESGTGKELVARAIHERSAHRERPLICVNCAAIPMELFESEFFGHVKGAFTGALKDRIGRFEQADGSTLFLDEVGELPPVVQGKLLRVLQEGDYERVGSSRTRRVNVRVIAATNRDLKSEVQARRFREDLYYRLNVFPIDLPPLRERVEDIPHLAAHFFQQLSRRLRDRALHLTEASIRELQRHHWPRNIRELQNVIERAMIVSKSGALQFDLPRNDRVTWLPLREKHVDAAASRVLTEREQRQQLHNNIIAALQLSEGRVFGAGGAAELLGLKPTTLLSRMKALGIQKPRREKLIRAVSAASVETTRSRLAG